MSERTNIEWASHTASPWFGCSKVSPGCTNCYAEQLTLQKKWAGWGDNSPRVKSKGFWKDAYRLDRKAGVSQTEAEAMGANPNDYRPRMFTSLMDWLDDKAPIEWLADFLKVIHDCQNLDWLLLSKRLGNFFKLSELCQDHYFDHGDRNVSGWLRDWREGSSVPKNVWFGVTVENQEMANERIPILLKIPAKVRWLSVEPLLEEVNLTHVQFSRNVNVDVLSGCGLNLKSVCQTVPNAHCEAINWVVVGGESGSRRRDCGVDAISKVALQCVSAKVPVFVKQDAALRPGQKGRLTDDIWALKQYPK